MANIGTMIISTATVLGFYVILASFSTTAFINELTSGMVLDQIAALR
jgi:hypothetical protein